ncbi:BREX-2 system adenine-specific DNA-methyltransferase PglX [Rhodococcoides corynebacterioides]|uniref:BREX-2 system adenine-specific DNA-methyltransferase PglX n=1 Tax=Rhodococcoides corynebacterioides TaxID=53972 RepID=UPI001C9AC1F9|nr:BREX-2 system adenine-specific DNA-methyltransferase PglX [Rhodococcus corynebacterioides]MBY6363250.1 BREX-2 system adenine-specific DNA-methyltransferase PglX [Rhodococcus corynebacterioides]
MTFDAAGLVSALRRAVLDLEADLRVRVDGDDITLRQVGVNDAWRAEHDALLTAERTGISWVEWRNDRITQAAVSWVLLTVFARYCEDNRLVTPRWISGPTDDERGHALDARTAYFRTHPEHTDRDWLTTIAHHFADYPATSGLVDTYAPMWQVAPSGDAARALLEFWWDKDDTGQPRWSFTGIDTRFLGDVYQDLSEHAKKTYALLQTPEFVEEFILDRTLEPALNDRPLDGFTMIDPTCGSGHFLLGAFHRLHTRWQHHAPALGNRELVQKALDAVHGVDINPFAIAIARFRLLIAALNAAGDTNLEQPLGYTTHLAAGDSLLWGAPQQALSPELLTVGTGDESAATNSVENRQVLVNILQSEHDSVVGNPPYISVKDPALRARYRSLYFSAQGKYVLTVPFMELFFRLARDGRDNYTPPGWVGQITSNSFMKREFGTKLIEQFLPTVDLKDIIDTSGAYIPGHGTPTVIIVGRNTRPGSDTIRAVLGKRGEPGRPSRPSEGLYWSAVVRAINNKPYEDMYVSGARLERAKLVNHPWSLTGGAAATAIVQIETAAHTLRERAESIGITSFTLEDDVYIRDSRALKRLAIPERYLRTMVLGDGVRDFQSTDQPTAIFPYSMTPIEPLPSLDNSGALMKSLWPYATNLANSVMFGSKTKVDSGLHWWEYGRLTATKLESPLFIAFAEVATHNHFILDSSASIYKQTAPVIKLARTATVDDHLRILGVLNTSTACFWLKQNCYPKGGDKVGNEGARVSKAEWADRYQFNSTTLLDFPLAAELPTDRVARLNEMAQQLTIASPIAISTGEVPLHASVDVAKVRVEELSRLMIAEQEELDWDYYRIYGLIDDDLTYNGNVPPINLGERAFEIALARRISDGTEETQWFTRHRSTPVTEIPARLPADYRALLQRRLDAISSNPHIELLERPEYKRRWATEPWDKQVLAAQRDWLLDRLENRELWYDRDGRPTPKSIAQIADLMDHDPTYRDVLTTWAGNPDITTTTALFTLLDTEHVPYLAAHRYKPSGLDKRRAWEHTWGLQRREDAGEHLDDPIPLPPKYKPTDFRKTSYWSHRGKLDVPKERFISYLDAGRDTDHTLLLGWAGWDHGDQALALATLVTERTDDGWGTEKLIPLIAGLHELQPWVRQWHNDVDPDYGQSLADTIDEELHTHLTAHHLTPHDLTSYQPAPPTRGRRTQKAPQ